MKRLSQTFSLGLLSALLLLTGCKGEPKPQEGNQVAEEQEAPDGQEALPSQKEDTPAVPTEEEGPLRRRVQVDGAVFAIAADPGGAIVATTQRGRKAAYLLRHDATSLAPFALDLDHYATGLYAFGRGLFGLLFAQSNELLLVKAVQDEGEWILEPFRTLKLDGPPAAAASAHGLIWLALRGESPQLIGIDPASGTKVKDFPLDKVPIDLAAKTVTQRDTLFVLLANREEGEVMTVTSPYQQLEALSRVRVEGQPSQLAFLGASLQPLLFRRDRAEVLPLKESPLAIGAPQTLPLMPSAPALRAQDALYLLDARGGIARLRAGEGEALEVTHTEIDAGGLQLLQLKDGIALLEGRAGQLRVLDPQDLSSQAPLEVPLLRPGRMALDPIREEIYLTLPEREEILVLRTRDGE